MATWEQGHQSGLRSAQPSAATVGEGVTYYVTDEGLLEQNVSGTWTVVGRATIADSDIPSTIARDTEVTSAISTHAGDVDAHHTWPHDLDDVADVSAASPTDEDVLTWDDYAGAWVAQAAQAGASALDDLTDVSAPSPTDGQVLTWDDYAGAWGAATPTGGGGDLNDLGDVSAPSPTDGQVVTWDDYASAWVAQDPAGGGALADLTDVDPDKEKTPADGDFLGFDGTDYVARTIASQFGTSQACMVYNSGTQTITASTAEALEMNSEDHDPDGLHDTVTNNTRITVERAGRYVAFGRTGYAYAGTARMYFTVNGSQVGPYQRLENTTGSNTLTLGHVWPLYLEAGDYVECWFQNDHASDQTVGHASVRSAQSSFGLMGTDAELAAGPEVTILGGILTSPTASDQFDYIVPFDCTVVGGLILGDVSGSAVVDVWVDDPANAPPTDADSITAAAPLTLSTAIYDNDTTLTGWTTTLTAGQVIRFNVDSASTVARLFVGLQVRRMVPSGGLQEGASFPAAPTTGQRYRRTDLDYEVYFYDGTRWLSETIYRAQRAEPDTQTGSFAFYLPPCEAGGIFAIAGRMTFWTGITHDGSNYFTLQVQERDTTTMNNVGSAVTTNPASTGTLNVVDLPLDVAIASTKQLRFNCIETGTAEMQIPSGYVTYRKVAT